MDDLVKYRIESAKDRLESARELLNTGHYSDSIGRSYYSIFTAVRAVLATERVDFKKHAGVISYFQKEYIKTHIFDKRFSTYLLKAFEIRNKCDYDDFYIAAKEDAEIQLARAEEYYEAVYNFVKDR